MEPGGRIARAAMLKRLRGAKELSDCAAYCRLALVGETGPKRYLSPSGKDGGTAAGQAVCL